MPEADPPLAEKLGDDIIKSFSEVSIEFTRDFLLFCFLAFLLYFYRHYVRLPR